MRKIALALALAVGLMFSGCAAGPHQLRRSLDNFDQDLYVEMPLINGLLWFPIPAFPIAYYVAYIGDFFITDAYAFWIRDVWEGEGTGFDYYDTSSKKTMKSLMSDDGSFLQIHEGAGE
ncbi:MAG: hypothetical protein IPM29_13350 [Planctomycetes bacterium]|nr:hypothetical protein [Planctomycetota bacterium]